VFLVVWSSSPYLTLRLRNDPRGYGCEMTIKNPLRLLLWLSRPWRDPAVGRNKTEAEAHGATVELRGSFGSKSPRCGRPEAGDTPHLPEFHINEPNWTRGPDCEISCH
jgi:hypothetical protein